jgi:hypothetical protein
MQKQKLEVAYLHDDKLCFAKERDSERERERKRLRHRSQCPEYDEIFMRRCAREQY